MAPKSQTKNPIQNSEIAWAYTDGACSGNPGIGGWAYIAGYHGPKGFRIVEGSNLESATTNNRMEMMAILKVMRHLKQSDFTKHVMCFTDSSYVANGLNSWVFGWAKNDWRKKDGSDVANADLWKNLLGSKRDFDKFELLVVPGHSAVLGNEYVDHLAVAAYQQKMEIKVREVDDPSALTPAFSEIPLLRENMEKSSSSSSSSSSKKKALFYMSYLEGKLEKHQTWKECEARVKGRSGAKFKKVTAPEEEATIKKGWGI